MMTSKTTLRIAGAQIAPVWGDKARTLEKILAAVSQAADEGAQLVAFGEGLLPGYPFWIDLTDGARFNDRRQKEIFAHYARQSVVVEEGDLAPLARLCAQRSIAAYVGCIERAADRGGHSLYCSLIYIDADGVIQSVHRKLMPTYEESLAWSPGDGHGLVTHRLGAFTVGGLNCWENWMPMARAALYGQGEDLHVASWPGSARNTRDLTPVLAKEGRSYVMSVSSLMRPSDFPEDTPYLSDMLEALKADGRDYLADGGSCIAAPDGSLVVEPIIECERVFCAEIDHARVLEERQNFDPAGHYSRPDVLKLVVNRERQQTVSFEGD